MLPTPRVSSIAAILITTLLTARLAWIGFATEPFDFDSERLHRVSDVLDGGVLRLESGPLVRMAGVTIAGGDSDSSAANNARRFLRERLSHAEVRLEFERNRRDDRRRILARVYVGESLLNEEIVRAGHARGDGRATIPDALRKRLAAAESEAKREHRGHWAPRTP